MSATDFETLVGMLASDTLGGPGCDSVPTSAPDRRLADVHNAIVMLRASATVDAALATTAERLSTTGRFARVLLSRIEGSVWIPRHWHSLALDAVHESELEAHLQALRVPLCSTMIETEVVRRRTSQLVARAQTDVRAHRPFVDAIRAHSYVVAPVVVGEEVIALLHADHGAHRHPVSEADHDIVRHFADALGLVLESIALGERIAKERDHIREALRTAESVLHSDGPPSMHVIEPTPVMPLQSLAAMPRSHPWGLSDREAAVLSLIAQGLTNREIADRLFVSESTVKSHVKHIFKKQGATTRSELIAQVLRRARWQELRAS